jgi:pimeloyl-ACP methyl ester carboxylesterase
MPRSEPVDGFQLAYDRSGCGEPVVLLHGWPGDRADYRILAPDLAASFDVVVPDLRGFGESDKHPADPAEQYGASIAWYRSGAGSVARSLAEEVPAPDDRIAVPATVLWPEYDPLFPRAWADRVEEFFSAITVRFVDGAGHFAPLEYPGEFAAAIRDAQPAGVGHDGV